MIYPELLSENDENMKIYVPGSFNYSSSETKNMLPESDDVTIYKSDSAEKKLHTFD